MRLRTTKFGVFAVLAILLAATFGRAAFQATADARTPFRSAYSALQKLYAKTQTRSRADANRASRFPPAPAHFRESEGRGLLVRTWVNGVGPYSFAIDTGAGANILSRHAASESRVEVDASGGGVSVSGLSGARAATARKAYVRSFAIGDASNKLPSKGFTVIADNLPEGIDGVLDPTEVFAPFGYVIDMREETISAFDPRRDPLRPSNVSQEGAVVAWLTESGSRRPFVALSEGRRALVDTGSGFGLAVSGDAARALGIYERAGRAGETTHDLGGGRIASMRVRSATVYVGQLALRNVPTDYLPNVRNDAPVLLGRDALRPFRIIFDPVNRLIGFDPR